ncbi:YihY/virulence factor BrkB family protein [Chloroflexota bacterium]
MSQQPDQPPTKKDVRYRPAWYIHTISFVDAQMERGNALVSQTYDILNRSTQGLLPYLIKNWVDFAQRDTRYAASLAYYALFSFFPLILLGVTVFSRLIGPAFAQEQIIRLLTSFFPAEVLAPIEETIRIAIAQSQSFSIIAFIALGWAALSMFSNLTIALDNIFQPTSWRPLWRKRMLALGMVFMLAVILLVSLFISVALRLVSIVMLSRVSTTMTVVTLFLPLGLNMTIFALLFRYVPNMRVRWDAIWPSAVLGGAGWLIAQNIFVWYLERFGNFSALYGSIGTVMVLLLWVYISVAILLVAAELCDALNQWTEDREHDSTLSDIVNTPDNALEKTDNQPS